MKQAGAELCQAQVKLGVVVEIRVEYGNRPDGWVGGEKSELAIITSYYLLHIV